MRVLVLYAHPVETSFGAAVHQTLVKTLRRRGHEIDDCDLNAEGFDPVMSRQDRLEYHDTKVNRARVSAHVERLLGAEALAMVFPVWNMGFPAILKGYVDRVFLPGVSFELDDSGRYRTTLHNISRLSAVCTYGGSRLGTIVQGDPLRRFFKRSFRMVMRPGARCDYLAHYGMNRTTAERRARFLAQVKDVFSNY